MKKKQLAIVILVFVAGFMIGGLAVKRYFGKSVRNTGQILLLEQRADWERRAFQAYSQENPQVAIWALENLADVLKKHSEMLGNDKKFVQTPPHRIIHSIEANCAYWKDGYREPVTWNAVVKIMNICLG